MIHRGGAIPDSRLNTPLTALFCWWCCPVGSGAAHTPALIALTFLAGLVPIVGNLLRNAVITARAVGVADAAAVACLAFRILDPQYVSRDQRQGGGRAPTWRVSCCP